MVKQMKKNGFTPVLVFIVIIVLAVVGYFEYKNYSAKPLSSIASPTPVLVNAEISTVNNSWMLYKNLTYKFSFEFPTQTGTKLSDDRMQIQYPFTYSDNIVRYGSDISILYFDNGKKLTLEQFISNNLVGNSGTNIDDYKKYTPDGNNLTVFINRTAPGANSNQNFYVLSTDGKFVLEFTCFLKTSDVNHILSTIKFLK